MNKFNLILLTIVLLTCIAFGQSKNEYVKHTVLASENITQIAKKYKVTPYDIYVLNPEARNGISENEILLISTSNTKLEEDIDQETYVVKSKETVFGLAKKLNTTIENLENWNPIILKEGLKEGQILVFKKQIKNKVDFREKAISKDSIEYKKYIIQSKETKYSVAKKFNLTIEALEELNPQLHNEFPEGTSIVISKIKHTIVADRLLRHTILPKETLYSVSKKYNVFQMDILELNPVLKDGFKEGLMIHIPKSSFVFEQNTNDKKKLISQQNKLEKTLVLILPFNIPLMEMDTINSREEFLNSKNGTLTNISLDYYEGALMAIDSAKSMGYNLKVKVFDCESQLKSNSISRIIQNNDFSKVNAVIGPFFNSHVEQTAKLLEEYQIPVVSPLTSKNAIPYPNIFYAMPSDEIKRDALFDYFKKNNGNVLGLFSTKKKQKNEVLFAKFPELKIVSTNELERVTVERISLLLDPIKKNFVILDAEKTSFILNTTRILNELRSKYDIQLVVLELYEALDFEEIPIMQYANLKMMYPSITKNNEGLYYNAFKLKFKSVNNVNPNQYATRGFDVTLDTILRMYQENGFAQSTTEFNSEHLESKFIYKKIANGNFNTGVYLMQYTDQLTIEEVK